MPHHARGNLKLRKRALIVSVLREVERVRDKLKEGDKLRNKKCKLR